MIHKTNYQRGVSLAEMSIVLVIIGLITAAVTGGMKLKKSADLRSIISDIGGFRVAIESFDYKYSDLPGDMNDAFDYWGTACGANALVCNGDSDGYIYVSTHPGKQESFHFWQHLNLAGLIDGGYTGLGGGSSPYIQSDIGINSPAGKRSQSGYNITSRASSDSADLPMGNQISIGRFSSERKADAALLTASEAYAIDKKTDDGSPDKGKTRGRAGTFQTDKCITGGAASPLPSPNPVYPNRTYITTRASMECILFFDIQP